jgi:hypothetical protein
MEARIMVEFNIDKMMKTLRETGAKKFAAALTQRKRETESVLCLTHGRTATVTVNPGTEQDTVEFKITDSCCDELKRAIDKKLGPQ